VPATQQASAAEPLSPEIATLIRQLGDDDFHVRQKASAKLEAMGKTAIPALREARKSSDPEVHTRAEALLASIDRPVLGPVPQASGNGSQSISTSFFNGIRTTDVEEPGRTTHIEESPGGIRMTVAGQLDGKPVTRTYKVKSADELRKDAPDAFALFQQFNGGVEGQILIQGQGGQIIVRGNVRQNWAQILAQQNAAQRAAQVNAHGDNINVLEDKIKTQMDDARTPDAQRDEVDKLLEKLRNAPAPAANAADTDAPMRDYDRMCDDLRKKLAELKLPDPGDALPPPAAGRLGISAAEENVAGLGLIITHILPNSRAEKLGLKEHDVIQKVNHQAVHSTHELRKIVMDHPGNLIIEGLRDGKELKLEEKP
jgi:hypothetical protein